MVEAPFGTPVTDLLGGKVGRGVLTGGYHGAWLDAVAASTAVVSCEGFAAVAASFGAGVLLPIPVTACPLVESAPMIERMAAETIG